MGTQGDPRFTFVSDLVRVTRGGTAALFAGAVLMLFLQRRHDSRNIAGERKIQSNFASNWNCLFLVTVCCKCFVGFAEDTLTYNAKDVGFGPVFYLKCLYAQ